MFFLTVFTLVEAIVAFLSIWSVLGLAGFHTYLALCNITTNEDVSYLEAFIFALKSLKMLFSFKMHRFICEILLFVEKFVAVSTQPFYSVLFFYLCTSCVCACVCV